MSYREQFSMTITVKDQKKVYECVQRFKGGRTSVNNARPEWPTNATCIEVKDQVHERIRDNRIITTDETTSQLSTTK
jgi:hypothetical protein